VEVCTDRKIDDVQRDFVKSEIEQHSHFRLTPEQSKANRREFNSMKKQIIHDWESHYHTKWPKYEEPIYSKNGKITRMTGGNYDAHELIENSWGSPHEWWNIHPAKYPSEHQQGIHRKGGYCDQIYNS